jgi:tripartite-type tricarboxylate transporter receptor subunit TctC
MTLKPFIAAFLFAQCLCVSPIFAQAATDPPFPTKPLRLIVPVATGGLTDSLGRTLALKLEQRLGQSVVVENKGGAGGVVGTIAAAASSADGHTILMTFMGPAAVRQALNSQTIPYSTLRDFTAVSLVARFPLLLVVGSNFQTKTLNEFIALAKTKPADVSYASAGVGSTGHLAMELFQRDIGVKILHVPYKGEAPAMIDVMEGRVSALWMSLSVAYPQIKDGKLRALGIANKERHPGAPEIPTIGEAGLKGFEFTGWYGMLVPAATPAPVVQILAKEFVAIVNDPGMKRQYETYGIEQAAYGPEQFGQLIKTEIDKWQRLGMDTGLSID